jgi:hypothetical protein
MLCLLEGKYNCTNAYPGFERSRRRVNLIRDVY